MKEGIGGAKAWSLLPLYPTWFRWKLLLCQIYSITFGYFISHMVQMKAVRSVPNPPTSYLYIPHGSDESRSFHKKASDAIAYFISHMVQMKGDLTRRPSKVKTAFISHMVQMKEDEDLPPCTPDEQLYIPHGSDERRFTDASILEAMSTLYPTWFRWKSSRYIVSTPEADFISHMVQMKA